MGLMGVKSEEDNDVIQLDGMADSKLHKVMLEAEEMGLSIKWTKKTSIEIS